MDERTALIIRPEVEVLEPDEITQEEWGNLQRAAAQLDPRLAAMMQLFGQVTGQAVSQALAAAGIREAPKLGDAERAPLWMEAWEEWLRTDSRHGGRPRPQNTVDAYAAAWRDFREFREAAGLRTYEWLVTGQEVQAWLDDLGRRALAVPVQAGLVRAGRRQNGQVGFAPRTQQQYLAAISSFFSWAAHYRVPMLDGSTVPLFSGINPAKDTTVRRPVVDRDEQPTRDLTLAEARRLLNAIRRDMRPRPVTALRNYALFLAYLETGSRNREIRELRWKDIKRRGNRVYYWYDNKGKARWAQLHSAVYTAMEDYLRAVGRLESIQPGDYIFRAEANCVLSNWGGRERNTPLCEKEVNRALRRYARLAEIPQPEQLHIHCLRHTLAMILDEDCGADVRAIQERLGHANSATTDHYLAHRRGSRNPFADQVHALLTGDDALVEDDPFGPEEEQPALAPALAKRRRR